MKKLTNTYFTKSKHSDKAKILQNELVNKKLIIPMHKKNSKSLSDNGNYRLHKRTKVFSEDMLD